MVIAHGGLARAVAVLGCIVQMAASGLPDGSDPGCERRTTVRTPGAYMV